MFDKMLEAKKAAMPKSGFNLVGVDKFERDPSDALYVIDHYDSREEADDALARRAEANPDETLYIYGAPKG